MALALSVATAGPRAATVICTGATSATSSMDRCYNFDVI